MDKLKILNRIRQLYLENKNIMAYLRDLKGNDYNSTEDIMISYDFQAGTYVDEYKSNTSFTKSYCNHLAKTLEQLGEYESLLEVGVGEATTLGPLTLTLNKSKLRTYGFDLSWSRIRCANRFCAELGIDKVELFTGDLFCAPIKDNSIDIVYTSHSIEPNGGREEEALKELYRITRKYLVLLEPAYELAQEEARQRMKRHGYITKLYSTARNLDYKIIEHRLFDICSNSLNPTGLMIVDKTIQSNKLDPICCPITKTDLIRTNDSLFSQESLLAYPIIGGIPCLMPQNAVIATKYLA